MIALFKHFLPHVAFMHSIFELAPHWRAAPCGVSPQPGDAR